MRWRARSAAALAVLDALLAAMPVAAAPSKPTPAAGPTGPTAPAPLPPLPPAAPAADSSYVDPARDLGATSPSCRYALDAAGRRACRSAGTPLRAYPLSAYGLDVRAGFSISDPGRTFMSALGSIGAGIWMGLLYLVHAVLLLLEWAFSLDLTNQAMPDTRRALDRLHTQVFGETWLMAAISITGVWGIWRGLIQRRATETMVGLAATVALIIGGMVIIARPGETVGRAAQMTNQGAISVLAAATSGRSDDPRAALTTSLRGVFDATIRDPWCAMQFGSVEHCQQGTPDRSRPTVADVWLSYPAQGWERDRLHKLTKNGKQGDGDGLLDTAGDVLGFGDDRELPDETARLIAKAPERARMQEAGGTFPRLALLAMVTIGLSGAVALYGLIGLRLILASAMTLLLLLITPAMLIAPALGDSGRATFVAWFKRLIGAIAAKLVYGIFLAVVLTAGRVFTALELGWFGTWLVLATFWWGVFLKRSELTEFVTAGIPRRETNTMGNALAGLLRLAARTRRAQPRRRRRQPSRGSRRRDPHPQKRRARRAHRRHRTTRHRAARRPRPPSPDHRPSRRPQDGGHTGEAAGREAGRRPTPARLRRSPRRRQRHEITPANSDAGAARSARAPRPPARAHRAARRHSGPPGRPASRPQPSAHRRSRHPGRPRRPPRRPPPRPR